jgi:hypothetical protein
LKKILSLEQLSSDELARIRRTLWNRYQIGRRGSIVEVGFGAAEWAGDIDPRRNEAICFYVTDKRLPHRRADRIPSDEQVRVKRGRRFVLVTLPTDVIQIDRRQIQRSGRRIEHGKASRHATAGAIVAWRFRPRGRFAWGVLTVGHLFWDQDQLPAEQDSVRMAVAGNRQIRGRLVLRSPPHAAVDAAIVLVAREALVAGGVLSASARTRGKRVRSVNQLSNDTLRSGLTVPRSVPREFTVLRYLPEFALIDDFGPLEHALDVRSPVAGTFRPGTSGAAWIIARQSACQQFASWATAGSPQNYTRGIGQSVASVLAWCRIELAKQYGKRHPATELRLIREL